MSEPYSGTVGIRREPIETSPNVFVPNIETRSVVGFIERVQINWTVGDSDQSGLSARHVVKLVVSKETVADYFSAVYLTWMNKKWSVRSVEHESPNVKLTLGGIYDGPS